MATKEDIQRWLDGLEVRIFLDSKQQSEVEQITGHPGLGHLIGLMLGEKQGLYLQLATMPLSTEAGRYQAAVLQGRLKAVDNLAQTLLELFSHAADAASTN